MPRSSGPMSWRRARSGDSRLRRRAACRAGAWPRRAPRPACAVAGRRATCDTEHDHVTGIGFTPTRGGERLAFDGVASGFGSQREPAGDVHQQLPAAAAHGRHDRSTPTPTTDLSNPAPQRHRAAAWSARSTVRVRPADRHVPGSSLAHRRPRRSPRRQDALPAHTSARAVAQRADRASEQALLPLRNPRGQAPLLPDAQPARRHLDLPVRRQETLLAEHAPSGARGVVLSHPAPASERRRRMLASRR